MSLTILVDMDGVLCDLEKHRIDYMLKMGLPVLKQEDIIHHHGYKCWAEYGPLVVKKAHDVMLEEGFFLTLPPIKDSIEGFKKLEKHYNVRICSKPYSQNKYCYDEKLLWLEKYLGTKVAKEAFLVQKKELIFGDFLIDDKPGITTLATTPPKWKHILFDQPYNQLCEDHWYRMKNWKDFSWLSKEMLKII